MTVTRYIYFGDQLIGEADENNTVTRRYINKPDQYTNPIGHVDVDTGKSAYYHYDGQGNTRAVTDENENVTDTFDYDSWGNLLARTGMTNVPFQFGGEHGYYKDEELDTYYVMARTYDPSIIRWLSVDPLRLILDDYFNEPYSYVSNNPVMGIDPSGMAQMRPPFVDDPINEQPLRAPKPCDCTEESRTITPVEGGGGTESISCHAWAGFVWFSLPLRDIRIPRNFWNLFDVSSDECYRVNVILKIDKPITKIGIGRNCHNAKSILDILGFGINREYKCSGSRNCAGEGLLQKKCCKESGKTTTNPNPNPPPGWNPNLPGPPPLPGLPSSPILPVPTPPFLGIPIVLPGIGEWNHCKVLYFLRTRLIDLQYDGGKCKLLCCEDESQDKPPFELK